jgi:hypothetical protein
MPYLKGVVPHVVSLSCACLKRCSRKMMVMREVLYSYGEGVADGCARHRHYVRRDKYCADGLEHAGLSIML